LQVTILLAKDISRISGIFWLVSIYQTAVHCCATNLNKEPDNPFVLDDPIS